MSKIRILHITPWFPNPQHEGEGVFIAEHIKALNTHCTNSILHLKFDVNKKNKVTTDFFGMTLTRITLKPLLNKWRVKEFLAKKSIAKYIKENKDELDIVNFYIAYPNAINIDWFKKTYPQIIFTISEQWSAYHENFNLDENNKGRKRIASIFNHNTPLFTVSNALGNDIRKFANVPKLPFKIIPNSVDTKIFNFQEKEENSTFHFCSINNWSTLKNPIVLLKAFHLIQKKYPNTKLTLGGSGILQKEMETTIATLKLKEKVTLTGRLSKEGVIALLHEANVYCQSSNYETFSAICIEALATGTPVIATNIGGMKDFVNTNNGALVDEMTPENWCAAMESTMNNYAKYDKTEIANHITKTYNNDKIGALYYSYFKELTRSDAK